MITVYGIETEQFPHIIIHFLRWNDMITVYGIETFHNFISLYSFLSGWNDMITVYGIET